MEKNLGDLSRKLLKEKFDKAAYCPVPEMHIADDKPVIFYLSLNPAGTDEDAARDSRTGGLFLNYYPELENLSDKFKKTKDKKNKDGTITKGNTSALIYKSFYNPVLTFFSKLTGKNIAWEWCNYELNDLFERIEKSGITMTDTDRDCIEKCREKYNREAEYQLIMRDLVYYHKTSGFAKMLIKENDPDTKRIVEEMLNTYIDTIEEKTSLKLILVSSATTCRYVMSLVDNKFENLEDFAGFHFRGIPVVLIGSELSGQRRIDNYSKIRLINTIQEKKFL